MSKLTTTIVASLAVCFSATLLWSCGSTIQRAGGTGATNGGPLNLPAPAELRQPSAEAPSPLCQAAGFDLNLPYSHISPDTGELNFLPAPGGGADDAAYAMYRLHVPDYQHTPVIITNSGANLAGAAWIGFANFQRNRWDWQAFTAVSPGYYENSYDPQAHVQNSELLVVIVALSTTSMRWLVAGDTVPPELVNVQPKLIMSGAQVQLSAQFAYGGASTFQWEFDGGLQPGSSDEATPLVTALAPGAYSGTLKVVNPLGTDSYGFDFEVASTSTIPPLSLQAAADPAAARVGEPVTFTIRCGDFPQQEPMRDCRIYLMVPSQARYVAGSFNVGSPGGGRYDIDGLWLLAPVPPTDWLEFPDEWIGTQATDTPGMKRLELAASPIGNSATTTGGDVCNLQLSFSQPGTYRLGFMPQDSAYPSTYRDEDGRVYTWYSVDNSTMPAIVITP